jgi:gliding motility-associated protein GldL
MAHKGGFVEFFYQRIMPMIYGIGAAIVILGAMFKILHIPGAALMLGVGMSTEAVIFFLSAFEPRHEEVDWAKVYPELKEDSEEFDEEDEFGNKPATAENVVEKLDDMLEEANINEVVLEKLGAGFGRLSDNVGNMADLSDAAVASNDYAENARSAASKLGELNDSYASTAEALSHMTAASEDSKEYQEAIQSMTKNLGALNSVYEMELQDANSHLKSLNKFYENLSAAMDNMAEASKDTEQFREELGRLTSNLSSLNSVYGNMLSAMRA